MSEVQVSLEGRGASNAPSGLSAEIVAPDAFDRMVATFDGVVQDTTAAFAAARWPAMKLEPWVYRRDGKLAAAVVMMVRSMPLGMCSIAATKMGVILADESAADRDETYEAAVDHLLGEYSRRREMMLLITPRTELERPLRVVEKLKQRGFHFYKPPPYPDFYFVRVRQTDAEHRKSFAQKWRYNLSKSEKKGLVFEEAPATDLARFDRLYEAMTRRKRFPDYSAYVALPQVMANLPDSIRPRIFFVTKDGVDVAGAVIFTGGRTATYLYGATNEDALPLRAGYFMHARILSWLRDNTRAEWYDLGGTDGFDGLRQFKSGMIGSTGRVEALPAVASHAHNRFVHAIGVMAFTSRDVYLAIKRTLRGLAPGVSKPNMESRG